MIVWMYFIDGLVVRRGIIISVWLIFELRFVVDYIFERIRCIVNHVTTFRDVVVGI